MGVPGRRWPPSGGCDDYLGSNRVDALKTHMRAELLVVLAFYVLYTTLNWCMACSTHT